MNRAALPLIAALCLVAGSAQASGVAPSMLNPAVTPATMDRTICRPGWTRGIRPPTSVTQRFERQHLPRGASPRAYVVDHVVPLSLGGHPGPANMQLQTVADAKRKDVLERRLHTAVCKGQVPLRTAQALMTGRRP